MSIINKKENVKKEIIDNYQKITLNHKNITTNFIHNIDWTR